MATRKTEELDGGNRSRAKGPREKAKFPLVFKLFLLTALIIVLVVALAIGVTIQRSEKIARTTVNQAIASAASLFQDLEKKRLKELSLGALTIARDPYFYAYIENALLGRSETDEAATSDPASGGSGAAGQTQPDPPSTETSASDPLPASTSTADASSPADVAAPATDVILRDDILDQLEERRQIIGTDVLMITDDQGLLILRTDKPNVVGSAPDDFYQTQPMVKKLIDSGAAEPASGVLTSEGKLFHAAVAPMVVGTNKTPIAYLVSAYAIDEKFANQIAETTKTGVLFLTRPEKGQMSESSPRSTNAPSAANLRNMSFVQQLVATGKMLRPETVSIDRSSYVMTGEPLTSAAQPMGGAVFVRSLDTELAPFREIERTLLIAGGLALLLSFIMSWLTAKRLTRPIEQLASMAQSITEGDLSVRPDMKRSDEVGILARSFGQMISALRDKSELEELYVQMSARVEEKESGHPALQPATLEEGTILVTDLRGMTTSVGEGTAAEVVSLITRAMRIQEVEVRRQEGRVREIVGHHLVSVFAGERSIIHAIRAARAISEELALQGDKDNPMTVGVGISTGEFITGTVELQEERGLTMVGNAPLLALLFAWEAPSGHAYLSMETAQAAGSEILGNSQREEVQLRWLPAPVPVMSLPLQAVTTGMIRSIAPATAAGQEATLRVEASSLAMGSSAELKPGSLFAGRYQIEQILGRGGMGIVYKALDTTLGDEIVAIKTLPGDMLNRSSEDLERFKREIRLARRITHRNVLRTFDYAEAEGVHFISMEYVKGYTLGDLLEQTPTLALRIAMGIARQTSRGLQAAHEEGIVHRDIKPGNVLIDHRGEVKLMDFGIARMAESKDAMTAAGLIIGTPHYMSPEQIQGRALDARSDVYSMGVMIYEMLCGKRPFDSPALTAILTAHLTEVPKPPIDLRPEIGPNVNAIILRCLAKDPGQRYADAGGLLEDLDRIQQTSSVAA